MLKNTIAKLRGEATMNRETGNKAALTPSAILRDMFRLKLRRMRKLLDQPPARLPAPAHANGIQAKQPMALMSRWRTSPKYFGSQKMKKYQAESVRNFAAINPHTCR